MTVWEFLIMMPLAFAFGFAINSVFIRLTQGVWPWTSVDKRIERLKRRGDR